MDIKKIARSEIFGIIAGTVLTVIFVMFGAAVMVKMQKVMYNMTVPFAMAALCIGALGGGYITARINKSMGIAVGAVCGTGVFLILLALGAIFGSELGIVTMIRAAVAVISGALGGVLGVNKRKKHK